MNAGNMNDDAKPAPGRRISDAEFRGLWRAALVSRTMTMAEFGEGHRRLAAAFSEAAGSMRAFAENWRARGGSG